MEPSSQQLLTCPTCGAALEETFGGGGGCMFCLLQAGIGSEEKDPRFERIVSSLAPK
jgi:hypothetical protein